MKNHQTDYENLNLGAVAAMRDYEKYSSVINEVNRMEDIKKMAGLTSLASEELRRIEEMRKLCEVPDYMKTAMDKMNLVPDLGLAHSMLEEQKRMDDIRKSLTVPAGIAGMVIEDMARLNSRPDFLYPEPRNVPIDFPVIRPAPDPLHKVNKIFEKTESNQAEIAGHLKELVTQAKGTSEQNVEMITLSKKNLRIAVVGVAIAVVSLVSGYYLGKSSSTPATPPLVAVKPVPAAQPVPAIAPVSIKK